MDLSIILLDIASIIVGNYVRNELLLSVSYFVTIAR